LTFPVAGTATALALLLVTAAGGAPVNAYTVSSQPAVVKPATPFTYTIRLTNTAGSSERAQRARIGIPAEFSVSTLSATTSAAGTCVASTWAPGAIVGGVVEFKKPSGSTTELCPGGTLTVSIGTSAATEGIWTWTTELLRDTAFALQGSQPTIHVDGTPPLVSIDESPGNPSNDSTPSFGFFADEPGVSFECKLDGGAFASCVSPKSYGALRDGTHSFQLRGTDQAGNVGETVAYAWTIATVGPLASIDSKPPSRSNSGSAVFTFSTTAAGATFACKLDDGALEPCSSPRAYAGLLDGPHTFQVHATDVVGNEGSPAGYGWTVDRVPPTPAIAQPVDGSSTNDTTPPFSGTAGAAASDSPSVTVRIHAGSTVAGPLIQTLLMTRTGASWSGAAGPLAEGVYTARAEQTDEATNTGYSTPITFILDTGGPGTAITERPANPTLSDTATFRFSSTDPLATFRCSLDAGDFVPCSSPVTFGGLGPGAHLFAVNATDPAGNTGGNATYLWTVAIPPSPPPAPPAPPSPSAPPPPTPDVVPPHEVASVRVKAADASVTLTWTLPRDPDFDRVSVSRTASGKGARATTIYQGTKRSLTDRRLKNGVRYRYRISTHDRAGNRSAGVLVAATPQAPLVAPKDGVSVSAPPLLRWQAVPRATYYNVQIWLVRSFGQAKTVRPGKVLSSWPSPTRLKLSSRWRFEGKVYRLVPGQYRWYVFPGLGKRSAARYGALLGQSSFTVIAKKAAR
jgi:hypothetical protein